MKSNASCSAVPPHSRLGQLNRSPIYCRVRRAEFLRSSTGKTPSESPYSVTHYCHIGVAEQCRKHFASKGKRSSCEQAIRWIRFMNDILKLSMTPSNRDGHASSVVSRGRTAVDWVTPPLIMAQWSELASSPMSLWPCMPDVHCMISGVW